MVSAASIETLPASESGIEGRLGGEETVDRLERRVGTARLFVSTTSFEVD